VIAQASISVKEIVDQAVDAAHSAFIPWCKISSDGCAKLLEQYGKLPRHDFRARQAAHRRAGQSLVFSQHECESIRP
jgi:acyl-CoA reductase-like NAD-dependent aldehyde dehydrogenase